jgi:sarcosine oxidase subunit beta
VTRSELRGYDVVIVGGGIMGASTAWQLVRKGAGRVLVLERATLASGATGKTGALLRQHYTNEPEALLAHRSFEVFSNWPETVGGDCGYVPHGLVVTVDMGPGNEANIDRMRRNVELQNRLGIHSQVVTAAELKALQPETYVDDLVIAAFEPVTGYVDSVAACRSMANAATRAGVEIREWSTVLGIETHGDRINGVNTVDGFVTAGAVVCAAGPWSTDLLTRTGIDLPVSALRVQIAIVHRPIELDEPPFVYLDTAAGMFTRPWGPGRSLIGVGGGDHHDEVDPNRYDERNDLNYPALAIETAAKRIPAMSKAVYLHGHAGLYDMSPDAHPIIGKTPIEGLYIAAGFSGAGFKKGPAVGQCLAELIVDGRSALVDLEPFDLSRFDSDDWHRPWSDTEYVFSSDFGHKL